MIAEKNKRPGLCYTVSDEGFEVPVIDVTHDAFALDLSSAELASLSARSLWPLKASSYLPLFLRRRMTQGSVLMRDFGATYIGGMTTYFQKLGAENLGKGYAAPVDFKVASYIGPVSMRLRLRDTARLLAKGLLPILQARPEAPLYLLNIGGGSAIDSLNALLLLRKEHPNVLGDRHIRIIALDTDSAGPAFGARALSALLDRDAPLHGLYAGFKHMDYDWRYPEALEMLLMQINNPDSVIAVSSEGGLFEYGSDEDILTNLEILHHSTPDSTFIVGSLMRDQQSMDPNLLLMKRLSRMSFRMLGLATFTRMAAHAEWTVRRAIESSPLYYVVSLKKS